MIGQAITVDKAFKGVRGNAPPEKLKFEIFKLLEMIALVNLPSPRHFESYLIFYDSIRPTF